MTRRPATSGTEGAPPPRAGDLALVRVTVAVAAAAGLLVARPAWWGDRVFPVAPLVPGLDLPPAISVWLWGALLGGLLFVAWRPSAIAVGLVVAVSLVGVAGDVNRLQPWLYQYLLMLAGLLEAQGSPPAEARARLACRLVIAGVYGWSGLQKLNQNFVSEVFPWLSTPARDWLPGLPWDRIAGSVAWTIGLVETAIGVGLLFPRARRAAGIAALATHLVVLTLIGPLGLVWNPVVWPWNVAMGVLVVVLFVRPGPRGEPAEARGNGTKRARRAPSGTTPSSPTGLRSAWHWWPDALRGLAVLLAVVMPAANFVGAWDAYLSWSLYSGVPAEGVVHVGAALAPAFPDSVRGLAWGAGPDGFVLPLVIWSVEELGVPVYPEERVFRTIGRSLCRRFASSEALRLELVRKHRFAPRESVLLTCADLDSGALG